MNSTKIKGKKRNNAVGKKGCSGRKTKKEELKRVIAAMKEQVTQEALVNLANKIINKRLGEIDENGSVLLSEKFALPITLKAMKEKKESDVNLKLSDEELKNKLAERLAEILE